MTMSLSRLRQINIPTSAARKVPEDVDRVVVIVQLRPGAAAPGYVQVRSKISDEILTGVVEATHVNRLFEEPGVASVSISERLRSPA